MAEIIYRELSYAAVTLSYLKATGLRLALLINFGETRLAVKRFVK